MTDGLRPDCSRLVLLDKASGVTSFQAISSIKRIINKKTGHAGTLDKFAEGLLIVLTGSLTRLNPLFSGMDKKYVGTLYFGEETDTLDPEGLVIRKTDIPTLSMIESVLPMFRGRIEQTPPVYSAVHVNGKRAYKEARAGNALVIPSRSLDIHSLEILDWRPPLLDISVHCSKGTYIRSLARDIGAATGSAAYLSRLVRTAIGQFELTESVSCDTLTPGSGLSAWDLAERLPEALPLIASYEEAAAIRKGILPKDPIDSHNEVAISSLYGFLFDPSHTLAAVTRIHDGVHDSFMFVCPASTSGERKRHYREEE